MKKKIDWFRVAESALKIFGFGLAMFLIYIGFRFILNIWFGI